MRDFGAAAALINEFDTLGPAPEREAELAVLKGRVMEGLGRLADALTLYRGAAETPQRPAAARARLREIALRQSIGDMKREDATAALETLSMGWRGDETEAEALQLLGRLYAEDGRYRDAFQVMRTALTAYPRSEMTRRIQDEAAAAFDSLFLGGKGDSLPAIDALSLFYDFRDLTPVGRRGDEMIRKLADRLVSVDLLDQAAELLQHQVDNRLQGAARAQVAVRLVGDLSDRPQARPRDRGAARDPLGRSAERIAQPAPADRGARAIRRRTAGRGAGGDRQPQRSGDRAAARRHPVEGAALARGERADGEDATAIAGATSRRSSSRNAPT